MPRKTIRTLAALAVLSLVLWYGTRVASLLLFAYTPLTPAHQPELRKTATVEIQPGQNTQVLARELQNQGLISDAHAFHRLGRTLRYWNKLKVGEYEITSDMTPLRIFEVLDSGISLAVVVTVQEGKNMFQIAELLESKGFGSQKTFVSLFKDPSLIESLRLSDPPPSRLEGYLYPETYHFPRRADPKSIIQTLVNRHKKAIQPEHLQKAQRLGFSYHQWVTLASIIEKETGAPEERPRISSVFHNRLKKKMRLQSDPTTIYGIWEQFNGNLRRKDLQGKTPYNTYAISGLPAGPICNPGEKALQAALLPEKSDYLYFVSKNDGTHHFSSTFQEHDAAVKKFQLDRSAREGKSWRDLSRRNNP